MFVPFDQPRCCQSGAILDALRALGGDVGHGDVVVAATSLLTTVAATSQHAALTLVRAQLLEALSGLCASDLADRDAAVAAAAHGLLVGVAQGRFRANDHFSSRVHGT